MITANNPQTRAMTPMYHAYAAPFMVLLDRDKITTDDLIALVAHNNSKPLAAAMLNKDPNNITEQDIVEFINWYYRVRQSMEYGLRGYITNF